MQNHSNNINAINAENISGFSIQEKDGITSLHILLKQGEKIEMQVANHIRELYNLLADDLQELEHATTELVKRIEAHRANIVDKNEQTKKAGGFNWADAEKVADLRNWAKAIIMEKKGLFLPVSKQLGISNETTSGYGPKDIITKERLENNLKNLDKLFFLFQRVAFSTDDPRPISHKGKDEINLLKWELRQRAEGDDTNNEPEKGEQDIQKYEGEIYKFGLREEINLLFSEGSMRNRWRKDYYSYKSGVEISDADSTDIISTGFQIYKTLQLLGLYQQGKLRIKTKEGIEIFTGPRMTSKSMDGKLYYQDHEEKYKHDPSKFISDWNSGREKDVHIRMSDLKISDLSYGALDEAFALLGKRGIAPIFSVVLMSSLLPHLLKRPDPNPSLGEKKKSLEGL